MNINTMRRLDCWLGVPTCWVLTQLRRAATLLRGRTPAGPPRRIVIVKLAEQGATVLAGPALRRAIQMVGAENVFFLVFEENRPILDFMRLIPPENVIAIRTKGLVRFAGDTLRALARMRREKIDTAVDFEFFARSSAVLSYLSGARRRVGFHGFAGGGPYRGDLMTHRLSFNSHLHAGDIFLMQVEAITADPDTLPALNLRFKKEPDAMLPSEQGSSNAPGSFRASDADTASVRRTLRELLGKDDVTPLILLNANCSDLLPLRKWPQERYLELARRLLRQYPELNIAFTGAPSEAGPVAELARSVGSDRCVNMAGRTSMSELMALYNLAEVLITNDSGPAHFASLTGIDVVTLFGPETPAAFGVRSPRSHILWAGLACSPCVNAYNNRLSACRNNLCMQQITVDQVFRTVCEAYESRRAHVAVT
ncbi:MAG TPA: glycosyltransferase family 9 protein [Phycisphaerae bacterium]|nr:glycosyltransferase family 9 protein [Phycisphaerae bacterium]HOJ73848.1 glycosyltransferase family 9 protein [Phycisphaerae bacterium]HOM50789.1 glycosyltransferase family 9 protein [Phycisphaerae bacterium]HOQ86445.1 glycosyltransferase family 9 protein [Phycisphaerae bacterium]HPP26036.1 glycosyltransferase family 9 protein [Phycisphaerae bacterium]